MHSQTFREVILRDWLLTVLHIVPFQDTACEKRALLRSSCPLVMILSAWGKNEFALRVNLLLLLVVVVLLTVFISIPFYKGETEAQ